MICRRVIANECGLKLSYNFFHEDVMHSRTFHGEDALFLENFLEMMDSELKQVKKERIGK